MLKKEICIEATPTTTLRILPDDSKIVELFRFLPSELEKEGCTINSVAEQFSKELLNFPVKNLIVILDPGTIAVVWWGRTTCTQTSCLARAFIEINLKQTGP